MSTVVIRQNNKQQTLLISPPMGMDQAIQAAGFSFPMPCGGHHTCGKCLVRASGQLSPRSPEEALLCPEDPAFRLACCAVIQGDAQIDLPDLPQADVLLNSDPICTSSGESVGFAVDIGTTTIAVYLYALQSGTQLAREGALNHQSIFGADVIARIDAARQQPDLLQHSIVDQLDQMFSNCLLRCGLSHKQVKRLVITGNTTMLHFLTGRDASGIAVSPFVPESLFGYSTDAGALFPSFSGARLFLPRCISAYVGADIVCALLSCDLTGRYSKALLVDVGTNGEMALWAEGKLYCCSTAAGPAFEGAGLSSGMTASPGAITQISLENGRLHCHTVQETTPAGLCGTGALSTLAFLLEHGIMDETGRLLTDGHAFSSLVEESDTGRLFRLVPHSVALTQADIRQLQLAKAAVSAGAATLLHELDLSPHQLDALVLCGGFGCRLNPRDAQRIGMLPVLPLDRVLTAGNASGQGAIQLLLHPEDEALTLELAQMAKTLSLSSSPWFMEQYVDAMYFPQTEPH